MKLVKQVWWYILGEPFLWLFYWCFQPNKFRRIAWARGGLLGIILKFRLILPIFIFSYSLAFILQISLHILLAVPVLPIISLVLATALGTILGLTIAFAGDTTLQIVGGIAGGTTLGIVGRTDTRFITGITLGIAGAIFGLIQVFPLAGLRWSLSGGDKAKTDAARNTAIFGYLTTAIAGGITLTIVEDMRISVVVDVINANTIRIILGDILLGVVGGILGSIIGGVVGGILGRITQDSDGASTTMEGFTRGFMWGIPWGILWGVTNNSLWSIIGGLIFIVGYVLFFYRLPLYPVSALSALKLYVASRNNPLEVFTYLHHSSLYWDERVFLPLPRLKHTLLIAAEQNTEEALKEFDFIAAERPLQIAAARIVLLEIALYDLETRNSLPDIARASLKLTEIFPQGTKLIDPRWVTSLAHLRDASQDAARYCSPISREAQRRALEDMKANLRKLHFSGAFRDGQLNNRLSGVVKVWLEVAQRELDELESMPENIGHIDNPYTTGRPLGLSDTSFVGRRDLVQRLEDALGRGDRRPTLLLNGERRMGKTSALKQLPNVLGSRYIPIFYDLQDRGISSSVTRFFIALATEIYEVIEAKSIKINALEYERLYIASRENEAKVYFVFNEWLQSLQQTLMQRGNILLLMFDEFEKLGEAGQAGYLDLRLLLDCFRYIIQNCSQLALLFSGVHTLRELSIETGVNWSGYFVNVQTLRVSFLRPEEARQLITRPAPYFPSEEIFGEGVVDEIISETGCHPLLLQAVCSALIDHLNADKRVRANIQDVAVAVNQVLESWWDSYFRDLWDRTDEEQRACLVILKALGRVDMQHIGQKSGLKEKTVQRAMQTLLRRDLILHDENKLYCISTPIFSEWVERSQLTED